MVKFIFILLLGLSLRLWNINIPLLEFYPSRQIQTAEITRNLLKNDFNFLYPQVNYLGPENSYYLIEFPGYNLITAAVTSINGNLELSGRLLSVTSYLFATILLYKLVSNIFDENIANLSALIFSISPLSIMTSRSFQPDEMMLALSIASIYFAYKLSRSKNNAFYFLSIISFALAVLLKITALIFLPLVIFFFLKFNFHKRYAKYILFLALGLLPSSLWYYHAYNFSKLVESTSAPAFNLSTWFGPEVFFNRSYYSNIFGFEYNLGLLPIGMLLLLLGLFIKLKNSQRFLYWWLVGIVFYFVLFNKHNMTHEYYHLPLLPLASIFAALGLNFIIQKVNNFAPKKIFPFCFISFLTILMIPPTLARAYKPIDRFNHVLETSRAIQLLTSENDLIIGSMDSGPSVVYYSNRKGWSFEVNREKIPSRFEFYGLYNEDVQNPIKELEQLKLKGASIFASANKLQFYRNKQFAQYMMNTYPKLMETDNFIIFDLKK